MVVAGLMRQGYVVYVTGARCEEPCEGCSMHTAQLACTHGSWAHPSPHCMPAADSDVAFVNKPIWDSYLAFVEEAGADAAFQAEDTGALCVVHSCHCC